jgi:hypothetical protein
MDFRFDNRPATFDTFASSVEGLRSRNVNAVFYPGGGLEGHIGPVGLRLDVGDEMYFNNGTHNNLRVAFGPYNASGAFTIWPRALIKRGAAAPP